MITPLDIVRFRLILEDAGIAPKKLEVQDKDKNRMRDIFTKEGTYNWVRRSEQYAKKIKDAEKAFRRATACTEVLKETDLKERIEAQNGASDEAYKVARIFFDKAVELVENGTYKSKQKT